MSQLSTNQKIAVGTLNKTRETYEKAIGGIHVLGVFMAQKQNKVQFA